MNRRYKILIPLVLLLIAVFIYLRRQEPVEQTFRLFQADSLAIAGIEIRKGDRSIAMEKQDEVWMMTEPFQWRVQNELIANLFRDLISSDISNTVITTGTEDDHRYGLEPDIVLQVKLLDAGGRVLDHVHIGNAGNPFDYIRRVGSRQIYQTRAKVVNVYVPDAQIWRDPNILSIEERDILRINVRYRKNSYTLIKEAQNWRYTDSRESFPIPIENRAIVRVLNVLRDLFTMQLYVDDNRPLIPLFDDPECIVDVYLRNRTKRTLTFARSSEMEFILMLDDDTKVLYGVLYDTLERFTRAAEIFKMLYG